MARSGNTCEESLGAVMGSRWVELRRGIWGKGIEQRIGVDGGFLCESSVKWRRRRKEG
jgi:hypothetical protein